MKKVYVPSVIKTNDQINPWNRFYKTLSQNDFRWRKK
jgi:hypothetical protein